MKTVGDVLIYIGCVILVNIPIIVPVAAYIIMCDIGIHHNISLLVSCLIFTFLATRFIDITRGWALEYKVKK